MYPTFWIVGSIERFYLPLEDPKSIDEGPSELSPDESMKSSKLQSDSLPGSLQESEVPKD